MASDHSAQTATLRSKHRRDSLLRSTYALFLIVAAGLLSTALLLEGAVGIGHGSDADQLYSRTHEPEVIHASAVGSSLFSLLPFIQNIWAAARRRRLHWQLIIVLAVVTVSAVRGAVWAAVVAFLLSLAWFVFLQLSSARSEQRPR